MNALHYKLTVSKVICHNNYNTSLSIVYCFFPCSWTKDYIISTQKHSFYEHGRQRGRKYWNWLLHCRYWGSTNNQDLVSQWQQTECVWHHHHTGGFIHWDKQLHRTTWSISVLCEQCSWLERFGDKTTSSMLVFSKIYNVDFLYAIWYLVLIVYSPYLPITHLVTPALALCPTQIPPSPTYSVTLSSLPSLSHLPPHYVIPSYHQFVFPLNPTSCPTSFHPPHLYFFFLHSSLVNPSLLTLLSLSNPRPH